MKKIILFSAAIMLIAATVLSADNDKKAMEKETARKVEQMVNSKNFEVWVTSILPQGAPSIISNREYSIKVEDGKANGRLPFWGTSYTSVFGSDDSSVLLEDVPVTVETKVKGLKKKVFYEVRFKTEGMTRWTGVITIWENGNADISCICSTKSPMSYSAELDIP